LRDAQDDKDDKRERVTLTTIHAAKGLEFDVVVCVGLEDGLFPHERAVEEGSVEEERRLAYVAFTRAKKQLVLTYASVRGQRATERRPASRFLLELPRELLWDPERKQRPEIVPPEVKAPAIKRPEPRPADTKPADPMPAAAKEAPARREPLWKRGLSGVSPASR
ncbi:MAG: 3'-5' exonuclease, partial [Planctomycetota bacterium]